MIDIEDGQGKECIEVIENENMILCIFDDIFIVTGFDGNEYCHTFSFTKNDTDTKK